VTAVFSAALALLLARYTPSTVPVWDASGAGLSLAAQFLQARKVLATWWVWIAADVLYIALYLYKGLWLTAVLYAIFMAMCVVGLLAWRRSLVSEPIPAPA
jgi:nicotinamide mononucleotide transporter